MTEKELQLTTCIHYYCLTRFYRCMQSCCSEAIRLFPGDHRFRLYNGLALVLEGRVQESIRELDSVLHKRDLSLAATLGMIQGHRMQKVVDTEVIHQLETKVREVRKSASDTEISVAALTLLFLGKTDKAQEYVDKVLRRSADCRDGRVVKGWIIAMRASKGEDVSFFDDAGASDMEVLLAKGMACIAVTQFQKATESLDLLISLAPSLQPAVVEKMRASLALRDWDQVLECSSKCQSLDRHSVQGLRYSILCSLVHERNENLTEKLSDLSTSLELREPKSARIYLESGQLLARLCQRSPEVMKFATNLTDRSSYIDPEFQMQGLRELGFQCLLMGKMRDAERHFKAASKLDSSDVDALIGLLHCNYCENPDDPEVLLNMETLEELKKSSEQGIPKQLLYLCALTGERRGRNSDDVVLILDQISSICSKTLKSYAYPSLEYYLNLEPEFLVDVVKLYLEFAPIDPSTAGQTVPHVLKQANEMLEPVITACQSHREPVYLMSRIKFLSGSSASALSLLDKCIEMDEGFANAYLLKSRIQLHCGHFKASQQSLDTAVSLDFKVRDATEYAIVNACLLKQAKKYEDAIVVLKKTLDVIDSRRSSLRTFRNTQLKISMSFLLAQLYDLLDQDYDSEKILNELEEEFQDTPLSGRIMIAKAVSAENKGALDQALTILRTVGNEKDEFFIISRQMMANIYLKYRNDHRLYTECFKEIADRTQTKGAFLQLGDAYMNILEPEQAIAVYEQCLKKNPKDPFLTRKVGQALVMSHFFDKAVTYYKASIKTSVHDLALNVSLKYDLADLLHRLKRSQEAKALIKGAMDQLEDRDKDNLELSEWEVKLLFLMSQVQLVVDQKVNVITSLKRAYALQTKVIRRIVIERPDSVDEYKRLLIKIGTQLADLVANYSRSTNEAMSYYKELLNFDPKNVTVLTELAHLELQRNNFESAQTFVSMILQYAPDDDDSALMMIDVMMSCNDMEGAFDQLAQFLDRKPTHYLALARQVEAAKRLGKLSWVCNHIKTLLRDHPSCETDPKFCYCHGVYQKATNDSRSALLSLYKCRADPVLGQRSIMLMIEIYLNPENQVIGGSVLESTKEQSGTWDENRDAITRLLDDLFTKYGESPQYHYLKAWSFIVRRQRSDLEQALQLFSQLLKDEPDNEKGLFGVATVYALTSQNSKLKSTLKRVTKMDTSSPDKDHEVIERARLLFTDVYVQSNKLESAKEIIRKILSANKSCIKAYEYAGYLMEKEGHYDEAAENYKSAFDLCCRRNAILGFKLSFSLLKGKHYSAAVDVGREVLSQYPDYPRLKEEVVDKALALRLNLY